jgi:serine/threonine protein phosphatase PrpC
VRKFSFRRSPSSFGILAPDRCLAIPDLALSLNRASSPTRVDFSAASIRGLGHKTDGSPRQDTYTLFELDNFFAIAVLDGVSSAPQSHVGANTAGSEIERLLRRVSNTRELYIPETWSRLNLDVSKILVQLYVSKCKEEHISIPESLIQLRENAADLFATTLEVLLVGKEDNDDGTRDYIFVNVCGDGALLSVDKNRIISVWPNLSSDSPIGKAPVAVLPATDRIPDLVTGTISKGENLLICTDGVSDFIHWDPRWQRMFKKYVSRQSPTSKHLLKLLLYTPPGDLDDKTFVIIGLKK